MTASPLTTKARLRPMSGTTSATVASATRSSPARRSGAVAVVPEARLAQRAVQRDERHVDDAGGAEMAEAGKIVLAVGIDERQRLRQRLRRLMMIEDEHVEAEPARQRKARG